MKYQIIGLMSGSSLDGLDMACAIFETLSDGTVKYELLAAETAVYSEQWQARLRHLPSVDALTFAKTHTYFGHYMADLVNDFVTRNKLRPDAIASHGHTVFHYPDKRVTVQIGDGAALAALTKCTVISDFRTQDIAIDGEGTPVAPIADKLLFGGYDFYLNIGGIANISCQANGRFVAFDVGAANQIFDTLAHELGLPYDDGGAVAKSGNLDPDLLSALNAMPFFKQNYPKSLDNSWLRQHFLPPYLVANTPLADRLHTACEQLAQQTALALKRIIEQEKLTIKTPFMMFTTGGGALNTHLIQRIEACCSRYFPTKIVLPDADIIHYKEALLIGLMGVLRLENRVNVLQTVTGAKFDTVGGAIWFGDYK